MIKVLYDVSNNVVYETKIGKWSVDIYNKFELEIPSGWDLSVPIICLTENNELYFKAFFYNKNEDGTISSPKAIVEAPYPLLEGEWTNKYYPYPPNELPVSENLLPDFIGENDSWIRHYALAFNIYGGLYEGITEYYQRRVLEVVNSTVLFKVIFFENTPIAHHPYYRALNPDFFDWLDKADAIHKENYKRV